MPCHPVVLIKLLSVDTKFATTTTRRTPATVARGKRASKVSKSSGATLVVGLPLKPRAFPRVMLWTALITTRARPAEVAQRAPRTLPCLGPETDPIR